MRQNKKELIRETAIKIMAEHGYHNSTTDRIAQEAGMAVGTIYNYFSNKEEILEYIFETELEKRKKAYKSQEASDKPALEKLHLLLKLHFEEISKNIAVGQILVREQQLPGRSGLSGIGAFLQGVPNWIQKLLDSAVKQGEIRPCNTRILASAIFGAIQGVVANAVFEEDEKVRLQILSTAPDDLVHLFRQGVEQNR